MLSSPKGRSWTLRLVSMLEELWRGYRMFPCRKYATARTSCVKKEGERYQAQRQCFSERREEGNRSGSSRKGRGWSAVETGQEQQRQLLGFISPQRKPLHPGSHRKLYLDG